MRLDLTSGRNTLQVYCKYEDTTLQERRCYKGWVRSKVGDSFGGGATSRQDIETKPWMSGTNMTSKEE